MSRPSLKILFIAPTPYFSDRGCHVRILEEARALMRRGHHVRICTYHLGRDMDDIPTRRIPNIPWYRKQTAGPSWHKPYLDLLLLWRAWREIRRERPDLIHAHLHEGALIGFFLKHLLRLPMVFDCQGSLTGEIVDHGFVKKGTLLYNLFRMIERLINRMPEQIVTSCTQTAEMLRNEFGLPGDKVVPIVDGVDCDAFSPRDRDEGLARQLGLPDGQPVVAYLGAMTAYQGLDLLLGVVGMVKALRPDVHFLIMGYPDEEYRAKASRQGLDDSITFTGKVDYGRAADYLALADLAISAKLSRTEANGKLFNYMACGLPTVAFDTAINREILGSTGTYAAYGSAKDLTEKILDLLENPESLAEQALKVRKRAEDVHSWEQRALGLEQVYGRILPADG